jgi:hypothetical protein
MIQYFDMLKDVGSRSRSQNSMFLPHGPHAVHALREELKVFMYKFTYTCVYVYIKIHIGMNLLHTLVYTYVYVQIYYGYLV